MQENGTWSGKLFDETFVKGCVGWTKENNGLQAEKQQQVAPAQRIDSHIDLSLF